MINTDSNNPVSLSIAVLTVSDTRQSKDDKSGALLAQRIEAAGHQLSDRRITIDDRDMITQIVSGWVASKNIDVIITTGGTGFTGRDVTPDAVASLFDKQMDGFSALFHQISARKIGSSTIQSRAIAGLAGESFIFALPGSPSACADAWDMILVHQFDSRHKPCNLVEIMPRLTEN